jgi:hypothetical protein
MSKGETRSRFEEHPVLHLSDFEEGGENVGGMTGSLCTALKSNPEILCQLKRSILSIKYFKLSQEEIWLKNQIASVWRGLDDNIFSDKNIQKNFAKELKNKKLPLQILNEDEIIERREKLIKKSINLLKTIRTKMRRVKAWGTDKELFGEVISSIVSESITNSDTKGALKLAPKVSLVYDPKGQSLAIASLYLKNVQGTLDDYAFKQDGTSQGAEKHIAISIDEKISKSGVGVWNIKDKDQLKKDLLKSLALSALSANHDVNPTNMLVVKDDEGNDRVATIDLGHAFNDMINHPFTGITGNSLGAGLYEKDNRILDFLNREELVNAGDRETKLWRDFIGIVPSKELAEAFRELADSQDIDRGLDRAKKHFQEFAEELKKDSRKKGNKELIQHVKDSLVYMNSDSGGDPIDSKLNIDQVIEKTFKNLNSFYKKGQKQIKEAAELIDMQCDIDDMIKKELNGEKTEAISDKIHKSYEKIKEYKGIKVDGSDSIKWIKNSRKGERFQGSLDSFIKHRKEKITTARYREGIINLDSQNLIDKKKGGANDSGKFGGEYIIDGKKNLVKREKDESKNMAEFMGSKLFQNLSPGYGADVRFAKFRDDEEIYVASEFFDDFKDLYKDAYGNLGGKVPKDRPRMVDSWNKTSFINGLKKGEYKGFAEIMPLSLLMGDFDVHWGNVGAVGEKGPGKKLVRFDFAGSFDNLEDEIHPNSDLKHMPLKLGKKPTKPLETQPTNHFKEYPLEMKLDPKFIEELKCVSKSDIKQTIQKGIAELKKYYSEDKIIAFGKKAGIKDPQNIKDVEDGLIDKLKNRQKSLKNFATELEIAKCLKKTEGQWSLGSYKNSSDVNVGFEQVVRDNPKYFKKAIESGQDLHFRDPAHKNTWFNGADGLSEFVKKDIVRILKTIEAEKEPGSNTNRLLDRLRNPGEQGDAVMYEEPDKPINPVKTDEYNWGNPQDSEEKEYSENRGGDKSKNFDRQDGAVKRKEPDKPINPVKTDEYNGGNPQDSSERNNIRNDKFLDLSQSKTKEKDNDVIMSAYKQLALIQRLNLDIKKDHDIEERNAKLKGVNEDNALKNTLYQFEAEIYKEIEEKFANEFQPMQWGEDGNIIDSTYSLKRTMEEITIDGQKIKAINLDFPIKIDAGPLHLVIPLKDSNGDDMQEGALYFTAHYNEKGELIHTTYPMSTEFDKNSKQGFVKKDGKIYTLPVYESKFKKMNSAISTHIAVKKPKEHYISNNNIYRNN